MKRNPEFNSGISAKNLIHGTQLMTADNFQKFDYGYDGNMEAYGQEKPPIIDISKITVPIAMIVGEYDTLANHKDC